MYDSFLSAVIVAAFLAYCWGVYRYVNKPRDESKVETDPQLIERLVSERQELSEKRRLASWLSVALGIPGLILLVYPQTAGLRPSLVVVLQSIGLALFVPAGAFLAIYRGQNPLWGLLSIASMALVSLLPDRNQNRLWEIEERLPEVAREETWRLGTPKYFWAAFFLALIAPLAPFAFGLAIAGYRHARQARFGLDRAVFAVVWSAFFTMFFLCFIAIFISASLQQ
jgi:hypothetical protein